MRTYLTRRDVLSGLCLLAFGLFALWESSHYRFGTPARMGPGFFPAVISALIAACGVLLLIQSFAGAGAGERADRPKLRSILAGAGAVIVFAFCLRPLGMFVATAALVLVTNLSGHRLRPRALLGLIVALSAIVYGLFIVGLGMPIPLLPS